GGKLRGGLILGLGPIERGHERDDALPHRVRLQPRQVCDVLADLAEACEAPVTLDDKIELLQLRDAARAGGVQHQVWRVVKACGEELDGRGHARGGVLPPPSTATATSR